MALGSTRLDHRVELLTSMMEHRIKVLMDALQPPGAPKPLTEQMTNQDALAFWRKHRYTPVGQAAMAGWSQAQILQLDAFLARNPDPTLRVVPGP